MVARLLAALCVLICYTSPLFAQITTTTNKLLLTDGGFDLLIEPPNTGTQGTYTWTLPIAPSGIASGFVQSGTSLLTSLQWDDASKYWKAVAGGGGNGINGSGADNYLSRWTSGGVALTSSLIYDNGMDVTIGGNTVVSGDVTINGTQGLGDLTASGSLSIFGYSRLGPASTGAPLIRMKKLTGTTSASTGGTTTVSHGINSAKILSVEVLVDYCDCGNYVPPAYNGTGYRFSYNIDASVINIVLDPGVASQNITSRGVKILVTYEQ